MLIPIFLTRKVGQRYIMLVNLGDWKYIKMKYISFLLVWWQRKNIAEVWTLHRNEWTHSLRYAPNSGLTAFVQFDRRSWSETSTMERRRRMNRPALRIKWSKPGVKGTKIEAWICKTLVQAKCEWCQNHGWKWLEPENKHWIARHWYFQRLNGAGVANKSQKRTNTTGSEKYFGQEYVKGIVMPTKTKQKWICVPGV